MNTYYANVPYCAHPVAVKGDNEKQARQQLRNKLCCVKLPKGTKLYKQG